MNHEGMRFSWRKLPAGLRDCLADLVEVKPNTNDAVWSAAVGSESPSTEWLADNWLYLRDEWLYWDVPNARALSRELMGRGLGHVERYGRSREEVYAYLCSCRAGRSLLEELELLLWELGGVRPRAKSVPGEKADTSVESVDAELEPFRGLRRWAQPENPQGNPFIPYEHQVEAWTAMDRAMERVSRESTGRGLRGLLVLPTGAGKTATAVRWLCDNHLRPGSPRPVLWIAHRAELLEQASLAFGQHVDASGRDRSDPLDVQCLSSRHGRGVERLNDTEVEVTCASIMTLVAGDNELVVEHFFEKNPDAFVVIDEAHHTAARSYRWLMGVCDQHPGVDVLGLTATPTRTAEREQGWLASLYPDGIVYETDLPELISKGILARPRMTEVDTGEKIELSPKERRHLQRFSDYSPETLQRLADSISRNSAIVDHYLANRERYGRTLVFATNVAHAMTLAERFRAKGITADYVTHVMEMGHASPQEVLADFGSGKLQVLTSVTKLTEGVDVPGAQTVLLARPTRSEILLKQMVGRAMRGPAAKGTEEAHLVSFADHWEDFADLLDPRSLFPPKPIAEPEETERRRTESVEVPWDLYRELARQIRQVQRGGQTDTLDLVPAGWYDLSAFEGEVDQLPLEHVLVFDHQLDTLDAYFDALRQGADEVDARSALIRATPAPHTRGEFLEALGTYFDEIGEAPPFVPFAERDTYLPLLVARRYVAEPSDSDIEHASAVWESTPAKHVYPDKKVYVRDVRRHVEDLTLDGEGWDEWSPMELGDQLRKPLAPGSWDLTELCEEVHREMGIAKPLPEVCWSGRPLRRYWAYYNASPARITVNSVLQTDSISRASLKFLLYHELLHHELGVEIGHRGDFRSMERNYPNWAELSAELDGLDDWFETAI